MVQPKIKNEWIVQYREGNRDGIPEWALKILDEGKEAEHAEGSMADLDKGKPIDARDALGSKNEEDLEQ